jgi:hypothetical protein
MVDQELCIEFDCMVPSDDGGCAVRVQHCSQDEPLQRWKANKISKIFAGNSTALRPAASSNYCLYVNPDSRAGVVETPPKHNGEFVTLRYGCGTKVKMYE